MPPVLNEGQMKEIVGFAEERHRSCDLNHAMDHIQLTVKLSGYLAGKEDADKEICTVAAYLHDIAKGDSADEPKGDFAELKKESDGHGPIGAQEAKEFLKKLDVPDYFVDQVQYAISQHDNDSPKESKEAAVLWDADKLQLVGPLGFARIFAYHMIYVKKDVYYAIEQARYWQEFFLERFCTGTGRHAARNLHQFMKEFFRLCDASRDGATDSILREPAVIRYSIPHPAQEDRF